MASKKSLPQSNPLRPLPIRIARLHARLFIAVVIGIAIIVLLPGGWWLATRLLVGWNVGITFYLVMI